MSADLANTVGIRAVFTIERVELLQRLAPIPALDCVGEIVEDQPDETGRPVASPPIFELSSPFDHLAFIPVCNQACGVPPNPRYNTQLIDLVEHGIVESDGPRRIEAPYRSLRA